MNSMRILGFAYCLVSNRAEVYYWHEAGGGMKMHPLASALSVLSVKDGNDDRTVR